jgi:post-segregation antitoxin (ccd killing protein)
MSHLSGPIATVSRKRPVNLTLSETLIADLRGCTSNLSATAELLLAAYVVEQKQAKAMRQEQAAQAVQGWNALHDAQGSFADEHSTL